MVADKARIQAGPFSHQRLRWKPLYSVSLKMSFRTCSLSPARLQAPRAGVHAGPLSMLCTRQVPNSCLSPAGRVPERRGGGRELRQKRANSPPPSTAQLPGYCPSPGRHLLWVISICMAIITAFGKKIPLSKSPAELLMPAQNWRRQLRQTAVCSQ
jgi:hypothetical protein